MKTIHTDLLEIAFEDGGPDNGRPVLLLHGWPDAPCGWNGLAPRLHAGGWRTIAPYLRGSGPTRFLSDETPRVGAGLALAQDAVDLADRLALDRFAIVGHDWGARAAYTVAALFPERVTSVAALALAYQPKGLFTIPSFDQARRFWYQWFLCTDWWSGQVSSKSGRVRTHPVGDVESARLVHGDGVCEGRRELCQPRLGPRYTEYISFSLARRGGLGFEVRSLAAKAPRSTSDF